MREKGRWGEERERRGEEEIRDGETAVRITVAPSFDAKANAESLYTELSTPPSANRY